MYSSELYYYFVSYVYYCGVDKMRSDHIFEMKIHLYLNKNIDKELINKVVNLKNKRGLNKTIIKLLKEYEEDQIELFEKEKQS